MMEKSGILLKVQLSYLIIWSFWRRINEATQLPSAGDSDGVCVCVYRFVRFCAVKVLLERQNQPEERQL